jgi:glycolate oxidase FAD binding subunit
LRQRVGMTETFRPADAAQVGEIVAWAAAEEVPLEVAGTGSKRELGRPMGEGNRMIGHVLDLSALTGITLYEPEELVLTAKAGTPVAEIEAAVAAKHQQLAFEPPELAKLYGNSGGTLGGLVSVNLGGPRRIKAGAARDHVLGIAGVSGRGETFKAGGRVVKNVTGYDLCKVVSGAYGTLAALTEITVKVLPAPEETRTLVLRGLDDAKAQRVMAKAIASSHEVSGAAHLPAALGGDATTLLRLEGFAPSVTARSEALHGLLAEFGEIDELDGAESRARWRELRDVRPFQQGDAPLWRLSVTPAAGPVVVEAVAVTLGARSFYDWSGGLIWLAVDGRADDAGAAVVRAAIAANGGGHATLVRAPAAVRAVVDVFEPQSAAVAALSRRVKDGFDPRRILNPGRMYAGV